MFGHRTVQGGGAIYHHSQSDEFQASTRVPGATVFGYICTSIRKGCQDRQWCSRLIAWLTMQKPAYIIEFQPVVFASTIRCFPSAYRPFEFQAKRLHDTWNSDLIFATPS